MAIDWGKYTTPAPRPASYDFNKLKALWVQAGGDASDADTMAHVAMAESAGNPSAHNSYEQNGKTYNVHGLWQISDINGPGNYTDPVENARKAVAMYRTSGLSPWEDSRNKGAGGGWGQYAAPAPTAGPRRPEMVDVVPSSHGKHHLQKLGDRVSSGDNIDWNNYTTPIDWNQYTSPAATAQPRNQKGAADQAHPLVKAPGTRTPGPPPGLGWGDLNAPVPVRHTPSVPQSHPAAQATPSPGGVFSQITQAAKPLVLGNGNVTINPLSSPMEIARVNPAFRKQQEAVSNAILNNGPARGALNAMQTASLYAMQPLDLFGAMTRDALEPHGGARHVKAFAQRLAAALPTVLPGVIIPPNELQMEQARTNNAADYPFGQGQNSLQRDIYAKEKPYPQLTAERQMVGAFLRHPTALNKPAELVANMAAGNMEYAAWKGSVGRALAAAGKQIEEHPVLGPLASKGIDAAEHVGNKMGFGKYYEARHGGRIAGPTRGLSPEEGARQAEAAVRSQDSIASHYGQIGLRAANKALAGTTFGEQERIASIFQMQDLDRAIGSLPPEQVQHLKDYDALLPAVEGDKLDTGEAAEEYLDGLNLVPKGTPPGAAAAIKQAFRDKAKWLRNRDDIAQALAGAKVDPAEIARLQPYVDRVRALKEGIEEKAIEHGVLKTPAVAYLNTRKAWGRSGKQVLDINPGSGPSSAELNLHKTFPTIVAGVKAGYRIHRSLADMISDDWFDKGRLIGERRVAQKLIDQGIMTPADAFTDTSGTVIAGEQPVLDAQGNPVLGPDGKPLTEAVTRGPLAEAAMQRRRHTDATDAAVAQAKVQFPKLFPEGGEVTKAGLPVIPSRHRITQMSGTARAAAAGMATLAKAERALGRGTKKATQHIEEAPHQELDRTQQRLSRINTVAKRYRLKDEGEGGGGGGKAPKAPAPTPPSGKHPGWQEGRLLDERAQAADLAGAFDQADEFRAQAAQVRAEARAHDAQAAKPPTKAQETHDEVTAAEHIEPQVEGAPKPATPQEVALPKANRPEDLPEAPHPPTERDAADEPQPKRVEPQPENEAQRRIREEHAALSKRLQEEINPKISSRSTTPEQRAALKDEAKTVSKRMGDLDRSYSSAGKAPVEKPAEVQGERPGGNHIFKTGGYEKVRIGEHGWAKDAKGRDIKDARYSARLQDGATYGIVGKNGKDTEWVAQDGGLVRKGKAKGPAKKTEPAASEGAPGAGAASSPPESARPSRRNATAPPPPSDKPPVAKAQPPEPPKGPGERAIGKDIAARNVQKKLGDEGSRAYDEFDANNRKATAAADSLHVAGKPLRDTTQKLREAKSDREARIAQVKVDRSLAIEARKKVREIREALLKGKFNPGAYENIPDGYTAVRNTAAPLLKEGVPRGYMVQTAFSEFLKGLAEDEASSFNETPGIVFPLFRSIVRRSITTNPVYHGFINIYTNALAGGLSREQWAQDAVRYFFPDVPGSKAVLEKMGLANTSRTSRVASFKTEHKDSIADLIDNGGIIGIGHLGRFAVKPKSGVFLEGAPDDMDAVGAAGLRTLRDYDSPRDEAKATLLRGAEQIGDQVTSYTFDDMETVAAVRLYELYRKEGMSEATASLKVRKTLGDYANVRRDSTEGVLNRLFLFYPWLKTRMKMIPAYANPRVWQPTTVTSNAQALSGTDQPSKRTGMNFGTARGQDWSINSPASILNTVGSVSGGGTMIDRFGPLASLMLGNLDPGLHMGFKALMSVVKEGQAAPDYERITSPDDTSGLPGLAGAMAKGLLEDAMPAQRIEQATQKEPGLLAIPAGLAGFGGLNLAKHPDAQDNAAAQANYASLYDGKWSKTRQLSQAKEAAVLAGRAGNWREQMHQEAIANQLQEEIDRLKPNAHP